MRPDCLDKCENVCAILIRIDPKRSAYDQGVSSTYYYTFRVLSLGFYGQLSNFLVLWERSWVLIPANPDLGGAGSMIYDHASATSS